MLQRYIEPRLCVDRILEIRIEERDFFFYLSAYNTCTLTFAAEALVAARFLCGRDSPFVSRVLSFPSFFSLLMAGAQWAASLDFIPRGHREGATRSRAKSVGRLNLSQAGVGIIKFADEMLFDLQADRWRTRVYMRMIFGIAANRSSSRWYSRLRSNIHNDLSH